MNTSDNDDDEKHNDDVIEFSRVKARAEAALRDACAKLLEGKTYEMRYQTRWTDTITQSALDNLQALVPNFKFMVSCVLMQRRGTRLHSETVAFWDASTDGCCAVTWESPSVVCIVNAFALAL
ncbi:hypothetical protein CTAYLR_006145 [Chrysophaeum taylorii]|uniref:Dynein light chain n=1 Tax=Chrysophaeum taylorii TaxID=2483200 RepID=A0AAD7XRQ7_9STRA|nr:hypothetical protein CTAYLR_006145 [Chrysophaeum taylorii]